MATQISLTSDLDEYKYCSQYWRYSIPFRFGSRVYYTVREVLNFFKKESKPEESFEEYLKRVQIFLIPNNSVYSEELEYLKRKEQNK